MTTSERPFFVIGTARSGTTLLRLMLSSHSRLYVPPESDFIPRLFLGRPRQVMTHARALRNIRIVLGYKRFFREWRAQPLDPERFVAELPALRPAAFLDHLYSTYARQHGALRWGDKSPIYTNYVTLLDEIFPRAQFIHLIRDGRDTALSVLAAYRDRFYVDIYYAARTWRDRIEATRRAAATLAPDRYLELRYEELTAEPEAALRKLCDFLGEEFEPAMCEPHMLGRELLRPTGRHAPVREPVRSNSGQWREQMALSDQRIFASITDSMLDQLGYETTSSGPMTPRERGRLLCLETKYRVLEGGRRVLQTFGVFDPH